MLQKNIIADAQIGLHRSYHLLKFFKLNLYTSGIYFLLIRATAESTFTLVKIGFEANEQRGADNPSILRVAFGPQGKGCLWASRRLS
jgi:hypothetical protein